VLSGASASLFMKLLPIISSGKMPCDRHPSTITCVQTRVASMRTSRVRFSLGIRKGWLFTADSAPVDPMDAALDERVCRQNKIYSFTKVFLGALLILALLFNVEGGMGSKQSLTSLSRKPVPLVTHRPDATPACRSLLRPWNGRASQGMSLIMKQDLCNQPPPPNTPHALGCLVPATVAGMAEK
jgi:hypothetical protein